MTELPLAMLAVFHRDPEHAFEHRHQLALRRSDDRAGDLGLLPEDLPVKFFGCVSAIELGLARTPLAAGEKFAKRHIDATNPGRECRVRALQRRDLRLAQEK